MGPSTHRHRSDATTTADSKARNNDRVTPAMKNLANILNRKERGEEKEKKEKKRKVKIFLGWSETIKEEDVERIVSRHWMN